MKRTWKDAWIEIKWKLIQSLFKPDIASVTHHQSSLHGYYDFIYKIDISSTTFNDFKAAFMKWLDENESPNLVRYIHKEEGQPDMLYWSKPK